MNGIILAAGRGSRMKGFTEDYPKCLNRVGKSTMLDYQVSALKEAGIANIVIITGYKADMLAQAGDQVFHNADWKETNMVSSLLHAEEIFHEPAIVSYSDIIYGRDVVSKLVRQDKEIVVVYDEEWKGLWQKRFKDPLTDAESFVIDSEKRIIEIGQKVKDLKEIQGQYTGLIFFSEKGFSWIKDFTSCQDKEIIKRMDMTTLLRLLIMEGKPIHGMPIKGGWCEIDSAEDLDLANSMFNNGLFLAGR